MANKSEDARAPQVKKVGPRRVRTQPRDGQGEEPDQEGGHDSRENDDRLKADKPPHY
ncbi:MAG: hypothetical protein K9G03_03470 [Pontimonas sp.]|nr:hypothetical protein [Pontimonas sp.]